MTYKPDGYLVIMKILVSVLVMVFAWALYGVGDVYAEGLDDIPSTGDFVMIGVAVVLVITVIIVAALNAGDDEEAEEEILVSRIEPAAKVQLRIDPVLTLQKSAVGAGLSFSF